MTNIAEVLIKNDKGPNEIENENKTLEKQLESEMAAELEPGLKAAQERVEELEASDKQDALEAIINTQNNNDMQATIQVELSKLLVMRGDLVTSIRHLETEHIKAHKTATQDLKIDLDQANIEYTDRIAEIVRQFEATSATRIADQEEEITRAKNDLYNLERRIQGFEQMSAGLRGASIPETGPKKKTK